MNFIIMAGGKGTRLFPLSRENYPKQFLKLFSDRTLLEETILRLPYKENSKILIVTNKDFKFHVLDILDSIFKNLEKQNNINSFFYDNFKKEDIGDRIKIISEPEGKNTAPAIAYSISFLNKNDTVAVLPSDHFISDIEVYHKRLIKAFEIADDGYFVTFGIVPTYPETGYGYIEVKEKVDFNSINKDSVFDVIKFKEKPDKKTAEEYIRTKKYFWNSGMFVFKVGTFENEIKKYNKNIWENYLKIRNLDDTKKDNSVELKKIYSDFESISVDYAICEHSKILKLIPGDFKWSDIGSFDSIFDHLKENKQLMFIHSNQFFKTVSKPYLIDIDLNNVVSVKSDNIHAKGLENKFTAGNEEKKEKENNKDDYNYKNLIVGHDKFYSIIGLENVILLDTEDVTIVAKRGESQNVKNVLNEVKKLNPVNASFHITVKRPWGIYSNIYEKEDGFKVKRISVKQGQKLSLQLHHKRAEHWIVVKGEGIVQVDDEFRKVKKGDHIFIDVEQKHRIECTSKEPLIFIEVQIGDYLGEDDIERLEDIYGRV